MQINLTKWFNFFFVSALVWLLLEGVFRKWFFPSLATPLFAIKYALVGITYFIYFIEKPYLPKVNLIFQFFIVLFTSYGFLHAFYNPLNTNKLIGILGFMNYFFFVPLLLIVPTYFSSFHKIEKFIKWMAIFSIPIFILGIIQYYLPPDDILNKLVNDEQKFNKVANFTRAISVFTFVKIYNVYLLFSLSVFISYLFYRLKNNQSIWFYVVLLFLGTLNMFMTGSRLPTGIILAVFIIVITFIFFKLSQLRKTIVVTSLIGFVLSIVLYVTSSTFYDAIDAFIARSVMIETVAKKGVEGYSSSDRLKDKITAFKYSEDAGWFGFGIGTTYQGTGMVLSSYRPDLPFEEEGERIVLELGIIGGILTFLLRFSMFIFALFQLTKMKTVQHFLILLPLVLLLIPPVLFLNETTFNYLDNFSYWFSFGLVLALSKITVNETQ